MDIGDGCSGKFDKFQTFSFLKKLNIHFSTLSKSIWTYLIYLNLHCPILDRLRVHSVSRTDDRSVGQMNNCLPTEMVNKLNSVDTQTLRENKFSNCPFFIEQKRVIHITMPALASLLTKNQTFCGFNSRHLFLGQMTVKMS